MRIQQASAPHRDASMDIARGLAIVAIVTGHVFRGLVDSGIVGQADYAPWDRGIYLVHLSVFVFVAGLLAPASIKRQGPRAYLRTRILMLTYLYLLWSLIQGAVRVVASGQTNTPLGVGETLQLWVPRGQLWFLPFMVVATACSILVLRNGSPWVVGLVIPSSIMLWGLQGSVVFTQGLPLLGAFTIGTMFGTTVAASSMRWVRPRWSMLLMVSASLVFALAYHFDAQPPTYYEATRTISGVILGFLGSLAGVAAVLAGSRLLASTPVGQPVALLGRESLPIFLAHIVAASGARILLVGLGVTAPVAHVVIGIAIGLALPLVLVILSRRLGQRWLFEVPSLLGGQQTVVSRGLVEGESSHRD